MSKATKKKVVRQPHKKGEFIPLEVLEASPNKVKPALPKKKIETHSKLGEIPPYISYEFNKLRKSGQESMVDNLLITPFSSWKDLYFSLQIFNTPKIHQQNSYEIYQNKISSSDAVKCKQCDKMTVTLIPLQTRGGDEPTTIYGSCSNCGIFVKYF